MVLMNYGKPIVQYIRDLGLKEEPCASCDVSNADTRCHYNAYFTNCPWTGRALQWARKLEGTYVTVTLEYALNEQTEADGWY